ncbi:beta-1,2-xylosyltransferase XYXT1-like isoform X2 [Hordeum vulgare subsp. vulgare]|uniref:beta-1,2-xylosyltransferase XYXT1-like isoform X2 n=1 Tax=Hordeum vulgare subsp. vulgare TaxID=112509 RepID=UPI000B472101|nr:beta-1,2-xylosyltransferase XYXT1-like isoform X2 [Hordeum vulgare subsp. vulgare]
MRGGEVKPGRSPKRQLNTGYVVGGLLMLLTYLVAQHFAVTSPHVVITEAPRIVDEVKAPGETVVASTEVPQIVDDIQAPAETAVSAEVPQIVDNTKVPRDAENGKVVCNMEGRSDTCEVDGDVRTNGTALSVTLVPAASWPERHEWMITPYSRRFASVRKVTVTQVQDRAAAPPCTVTHGMPAVLFAVGGYAANYWHAYADILVPLFVASRRYHGEVTFLISNIQFRPRWPVQYRAFLQGLSKYELVDMDGDAEVRCFPRVTVGLRLDKELSIVPELVPGGRLTMADFTGFLRETYALPRGAAREPEKKPRLLLIHRGHYRRILNEPEVARAAEEAGFEAVVTELRGGGDTPEAEVEQARVVNSFDVVLGLHGAGLTNAMFLPPGGVLIQVVPYGNMEDIARAEFSEPATDMGLRYLDYSVGAEESSLMETLGPEHPAIKDPASVHRSGWDKVFELYLAKQNVRINVTRFAPTLAQALHHLRRQ